MPTLLLCALALAGWLWPAPLWAQGEDGAPIFRRFSSPPRHTASRMWTLDVPVDLRPQTDANADVTENVGLGYELGIRPSDRVFSSLSFNFGRMNWHPSDPAVENAHVTQFDVTQSLNFRTGWDLVIGFGFGLGVLDSLVVDTDGRFEHHLLPYIPFRLGVGMIFGERFFVGLRTATTPFFAEGRSAGQTRLLVALGWSN